MIEFDYGVSYNIMVVGNIELINSLNNWEGILYLLGGDSENNINYAKISLLFKDKEFAQKSYNLFKENISMYKTSEIIDIIFVEISDGYMVFITQNMELLINKLIPSHLKSWVTPIFTSAVKPLTILRKSKEFLMFKKYIEQNKDTDISITHSYINFAGRPTLISKEEFIKNNIVVLTEEEAKKNPIVKGHFMDDREKEFDKNKNIMFDISEKEVVLKRRKNLEYFYPLTLDKILYEEYLKEQIEILKEKYEETLICQAICNLISKYRLKKSKISFRNWKELDFLEYLLQAPETFSSVYPEDKYFSLGRIESQIKYKNKKEKK